MDGENENFLPNRVTEKRAPYEAARIMDMAYLDEILEWANSDQCRFSLPLTDSARSYYHLGDWIIKGGYHGHHLSDVEFNRFYKVLGLMVEIPDFSPKEVQSERRRTAATT